MTSLQRQERRCVPRVKLAVPAQLSAWKAKDGGAFSVIGATKDVSSAGVYLTAREVGELAPGEVVSIEVIVPREAQRRFPFARIVGSGRIVHIEALAESPENAYGIALAFCEDQITHVGAVVSE